MNANERVRFIFEPRYSASVVNATGAIEWDAKNMVRQGL